MRRPIVLTLAVALALVPASTPAELPLIGGELRKIGDKEEQRIGGNLASIVLGTVPLVADPAKQAAINRIGKWIALHGERPNLPWRFGILDSPSFNAFSMPGGYVLVTQGLVDRMRNESELAAVLAHEIAHVERKHHIGALHQYAGLLANQASGLVDKLPIQGLRRKLGTGAAGKVQQHLDPGGEGAAGKLSRAALEAGRDLFTRGLARDEEFEADRMAVVLAARSGYSPWGLTGVLQTLSASEPEAAFALHTKTHPGAVDRIMQLDEAMGAEFDGLAPGVEDSPLFAALRSQPKPVGHKAR